MKPSAAYMAGWLRGCTGQELDESAIPDDCLPAHSDGHEAGRERRAGALRVACGFDVLVEVNVKAFAAWNLGRRPDLPDPPGASGCRFHYCWMPIDTRNGNHYCKAHGGKDCPLPKKTT